MRLSWRICLDTPTFTLTCKASTFSHCSPRQKLRREWPVKLRHSVCTRPQQKSVSKLQKKEFAIRLRLQLMVFPSVESLSSSLGAGTTFGTWIRTHHPANLVNSRPTLSTLVLAVTSTLSLCNFTTHTIILRLPCMSGIPVRVSHHLLVCVISPCTTTTKWLKTITLTGL